MLTVLICGYKTRVHVRIQLFFTKTIYYLSIMNKPHNPSYNRAKGSLSHYAGEMVDPILVFPDENVANFIGSEKSRKAVKMKIVNNSAAACIVALTPGPFDVLGITLTEGAPNTAVLHYHDKSKIVASGITVDAVADDAVVLTDVTVSCPDANKTVREFLNWIKSIPVRVPRIKVSSNNADAYTSDFELYQVKPYDQNTRDNIITSDFFKTSQQNDKSINVTSPITLSAESVLLYTVPAKVGTTATEVTLTLFLGALLSMRNYLDGQVEMAKQASNYNGQQF